MKPQERFIEVGARRILTRTAGEGRTVLLCPGAGTPGVGCAPEIEAGIAAFATLVTYDRAGIGHSDPPRKPPTILDMAADLEAVVDTLSLPFPMLVIGFSMGALLAQLFACRRPQEIRGLLLLDPTPDEMTAAIETWPEDIQAATRRNLTAGAKITPAMAFEMEHLIEGAVLVRDTIFESGLPDVPLIIAGIDRPDGATLRDHHESMALRVPHGRFVSVPGDGAETHADFMRDHPDIVIRLAREILAGG